MLINKRHIGLFRVVKNHQSGEEPKKQSQSAFIIVRSLIESQLISNYSK